MADKTEKYGGFFVYEISYSIEKRYVVANSDQVRNILTGWEFQKEDELRNADEINIKKMGKAAIEKLTLDRLVAEANRMK